MAGKGAAPGERRGGRQAGTPNKRTVEREAAMQEAAGKIAEAIGDTAFEGDCYAFLLSVVKDPKWAPVLRLDAAKAAVRYERPALSSTTVEVRDPLASMSIEQMEALLQLARQATKVVTIDGDIL